MAAGTPWFRQRYPAWVVVLVLVGQILTFWLVLQLEPVDPMMGVADAGFLGLPFSFMLLFISWQHLRARRWLIGTGVLLSSLPGLLGGAWSLYMLTL